MLRHTFQENAARGRTQFLKGSCDLLYALLQNLSTVVDFSVLAVFKLPKIILKIDYDAQAVL